MEDTQNTPHGPKLSPLEFKLLRFLRKKLKIPELSSVSSNSQGISLLMGVDL
jgi:hypothetical protein